MSSEPEHRWQRVAHLRQVEPTFPLGVQLADGARVCLVRDADMVYAVEDRCPHRDFGLSGGDVVAPCIVECPWHGARFDVRTGAVVRGPATDGIRTYAVRIEDGEIWVAEIRQQ